jgi:PAS domain S-box-containing protein
MKPEENRISRWIKAVQSGLAAWNRKLAREIRSRTEAETASVNSEEKFRLVFESANVGKSITLPTGEINVNQALCDMLGYTREELRGKKWQDITPPDEFETTQIPLDLLLQGKKDSVRFKKRYIRKNGSYVWADVSVVVHRDSDGKPLFLITTIIDITEHEKSEENMRLAHDRLRRFIDSNIVGIVIATTEGKIIETNDYYLDMIGFTREEFESGKIDWRAITPAEWLPADEKALSEMREHGSCTPYEKEYVRRDGTRVSVFLSDTMLPGPEEQIAAFVLDITERKGAENKLRESERKLREVQEMAHLGFWNWDVKTGDVEWSGEVFKIFCLDPKEFIPHIDAILELSPWPEDHQRDKELINRAIETHSPGFYEQKFLRPDQSVGYYHSTFQGMYNEKGDLISIVGTVLDITERKRAEEELYESMTKLQLTIDEAPVGVVMAGLDKRFLKCNKSFCAFLGYAEEELKEKTISEVTFPEDVEVGMSDMRAIVAGETKSSKVEKRYIRKDGAMVWGEVNINIIRDNQGNPIYFLSIIQDITDRKRAEEEIRALLASVQEEKNRLSALINSMTDEVWLADTQKRFTLANPTAFKQFCIDPDQVIEVESLAKSLVVLRPDGSARPVEEAPPLRALSGEVVINQEEIVKIPVSGEFRYRQVNAAPVRDSAGDIIGSVSVVHDITKLKQTEEEIRKLNEDLEQRITERTAELRETIAQVEETNRIFVGRELRMIELKERIEELEKQKI